MYTKKRQVTSALWRGAALREGMRVCYTDGLSADCLRKNNYNTKDTIPEHVMQLQSLHTRLSFAY